ncbi:MAG: bifunctional (p)ppGpp synthetase/guanosine-3',5'-bis(diphosphate) 3'-pyrophosphohydrolase, partial [Xanthomonadales bacterium]|nr:bifunctional (p)ppGpp synthetase/guanosine-3',5'-bis(diphosphate) 3'-pyrophosphohydrolase [Xanthomonadales bacterium]
MRRTATASESAAAAQQWASWLPDGLHAPLSAALGHDPDVATTISGELALLDDLEVDQETRQAALIDALGLTTTALALPPTQLSAGLRTLLNGLAEASKVWELWEHKSGHTGAEGLRRLLLVLIRDLRVVFVLLVSQVVRLRALGHADPEAQRRAAQLTADIHAPLANRLGIWQLKWELEDWTFRFLQPEVYRRVAKLLGERRADREGYIERVLAQLRGALDEAHIRGAQVAGRPKHIFSIWKKMQRKGVDFDQLYDVRAVRVLVEDVPTCYAVLGLVHGLWQYIPGEFDDYIAHPKGNDYRSLHTAVIGPGGTSLEVQIRTFEMHRQAELGVAAHWRYKEGGNSDSSFERKVAEMRQLLEQREDGEDDSALLAGFSTEALEDRVYVLTPKGQVVDMARGNTVLDFAYQVHTEVGHRCRGAKVNGRIVPLTYELKNAEQVDVLTANTGGPSRDWPSPHLASV